MKKLQEGDAALILPLTSTYGTLDVGRYSDKWLILLFYPKDFAAGCTLEAKAFQNKLTDIRSLGADIIGISPDNLETHSRYSAELGLDYELATDANGSMASIYGVLIKPNPLLFKRGAFLISPERMLVKSYVNGKISLYAHEILKDLKFIKGLNDKLEINRVVVQ
ncbi:MAG: redoxin domain-containing protein [Nitrososphaerota archaeon]|nr:redoxin domain-containing protein [Nitrososphaerota archaeon]MDG6929682.1 redoxin domain-containing protein [Nitrososphaerota archaeon]MDG6932878.1 redoxin domain-containing protein [Nitrososphaerota archaeon]